MLDNFTYKRKLQAAVGILGCIALVALIWGWQTYSQWNEIEELTSKNHRANGASTQIEQLRSRLNEISGRLSELEEKRAIIQSHADFIRYMEGLTHDFQVNLLSLPTQELDTVGGNPIGHITFSLEGTYHDILSVIYQLEYADEVASVENANFSLSQIRLEDRRRKLLIAKLQVNRLIPV